MKNSSKLVKLIWDLIEEGKLTEQEGYAIHSAVFSAANGNIEGFGTAFVAAAKTLVAQEETK